LYFSIYVRGNSYGINDFVDNGDGTISDESTGLMWQKNDNNIGLFWEDALSYCENLKLAGYSDWRLPNAKELQSIVDYSRCPDVTNSASIDPVFEVSNIINEGGEVDYPFYWTSTTHIGYPDNGQSAVYISFGRALGYWNGHWTDVHGAGAQRSDPKIGDPDDYPHGHGPQGDAVRIKNYVRCVREGLSDNQVPEKPRMLDGTNSGKTGVEYMFNTSTVDPDDDQVFYWFDWDDNTNSGWLGPKDSGLDFTVSNSWDKPGVYEIRVKAKDINGAQSEWSDPLSISIPKYKSYMFSLNMISRIIKTHFIFNYGIIKIINNINEL
jgi:hypothetical protein